MKEMVMLPLLPEGHFDVDAEDISGVSMVEMIDDGQAIISEGQAQAKVDGLSAIQRDIVDRSRANAALVEEAEMDEADDLREKSEGSAAASEVSDSDDDEGGLGFVRSTLLMDDAQPKATPAPRKAPACVRSAATFSAKPSHPTGHGKAASSQMPRTAGSAASGKASSQSSAKTGDKLAQQGRPSKFANKSPEEILDKNGMDKINEGLNNLGAIFASAPFDNLLAAPDALQTAVVLAKKKAAEVHKSMVTLDIKVPAQGTVTFNSASDILLI
jgi:hypothetical protein